MIDRKRSLQSAGACAVIVLLCVFLFWPLLRCRGACTIDIDHWVAADAEFIELAKADVRLNTWILGWVQHALAHQPTRIFEANVFHPAPHALAGSEHMLSVALLTAPLRVLSSNATTIYNVATALSFLIAGLATYAFVAWLTRNRLIALGMGAAAMLMPWRWSELDHLQLLFAAWLPAVWLLIARCLLERADRRRLVALGAAWAALLFSSYYLAYFSCFTTAAFRRGDPRRGSADARQGRARGRRARRPARRARGVFVAVSRSARRRRPRSRARHAAVGATVLVVGDAQAGAFAVRPAELPYTAAYSLPALLSIMACCLVLPGRFAATHQPMDGTRARRSRASSPRAQSRR
jgi:hypothetical protein